MLYCNCVLYLLASDCSIDDYKTAAEGFVGWRDDHHLEINAKKTEEVIIDPRSVGDRSFIVANIKQVASYKYLEAHNDSELKWHTHVSSVCTRDHQHLHFL